MLAIDSLLLAQHIDAAITMLERSYTTARLTALTFLLPLQALLRLLYCFFFFSTIVIVLGLLNAEKLNKSSFCY
jgi:hypothetical protein